jgi:PAP_fibrillin
MLQGAAPVLLGRHRGMCCRTQRHLVVTPRASTALADDGWTLPTPSAAELAAQREPLTRRLLELAAVTSRGQVADFSTLVDVEDIVLQLEATASDEVDVVARQQALSGSWRLVYSSVELFRSSPFFWAFQSATGSEDLAQAVFKFTAGLPVAGSRGPFGEVRQVLDLQAGRLVSEVDMRLFESLNGTVVTEARCRLDDDDATRLLVTVESTRVTGSNVDPSGALDGVVTPVEQLFAALRGGQPLTVAARTRYVDDNVRITRTGFREDQIFVYARRT